VNRMHSGYYSNTIRGAIYDPWAYSPTWTGVLDRALANGNFCYAAAQDALNGVDPTGGAMSFKLASSGHPGVVIGRVVFF
ncbi:MAG: cell wall hydrolase, partial [Lachnospiraceae bacterium]|nr:cell wall hydrolase [Lachnospiraceae bacterium]